MLSQKIYKNSQKNFLEQSIDFYICFSKNLKTLLQNNFQYLNIKIENYTLYKKLL